jgi:flavodoxin
MKKALIVFYSRTGTTRKVAEQIAKEIGADMEEIIDNKSRSGPLGYVKAGRDAMKKNLTDIQTIKKDIAKYDLVIIGTPIWAWAMTPAIRTFIKANKSKLKNVAFFCTMGGSGDDKAFKEMQEIIGKNPKAVLALLTKEVRSGNFKDKIKQFVSGL